jgi:hypothetical protein
MARSWESFAAQRRKYEQLHSSKDFRRKKPGLLDRIRSFLRDLIGR